MINQLGTVQPLRALSRLMIILLAAVFLVACADEDSNGSDGGSPSGDGSTPIDEGTSPIDAQGLVEGLNILPAEAAVSRNGSLQLDPLLYLDGRLIEPDPESDLSINWSADNSNISVDSRGRVRGNSLGRSQVTAVVHYDGQNYEQRVDIDVVNSTVDALYIDPRSALMDRGDQRSFRILALQGASLARIDPDNITFEYDERFLELEPVITSDQARLNVTALKLGYTQIIPVYEEGSTRIQGDPLHIHIETPPQTDRQTSGSHLKLSLADDGRSLDFVHTSESDTSLYLQTLSLVSGATRYSLPSGDYQGALVFRDRDNVYVPALRNGQLQLLTSSNNGSSWSDAESLLVESPYSSSETGQPPRLQGYYERGQLHLLYHTGGFAGDLYYLRLDPNSNQDDRLHSQQVAQGIRVSGMDFQSSPSGQPGIVYTVQNRLYYGQIQDEHSYLTLAKTGESDELLLHPRLDFDPRGNPSIAILSSHGDNHRILLRSYIDSWQETTLGTSTFRAADIQSLDLLENVGDLAFSYDRRGVPRLAVHDGESIYYLRQTQIGSSSRWYIDEVTGQRNPSGELDMAINRNNRLILVYRDQDTLRVNFWNEPIDLDYRPFINRSSEGDYPFTDDDTWEAPQRVTWPFENDLRIQLINGQYTLNLTSNPYLPRPELNLLKAPEGTNLELNHGHYRLTFNRDLDELGAEHELVFQSLDADTQIAGVKELTVPIKHRVEFDLSEGERTGGGELIQWVKHGQAATAPEVDAPGGGDLQEWSTNFDDIKVPITVRALYEGVYFTVDFELNGGRLISGTLSERVAQGSAASAPEILAPEGKNFTGWDQDLSDITSDLVVQPVFSDSLFKVIFVDHNNDEISQTESAYGTSPSLPDDPERSGFTFLGWGEEASYITGDVTLKPVYNAHPQVVFDEREVTLTNGFGEKVIGFELKDAESDDLTLEVRAPESLEGIKVELLWDAELGETVALNADDYKGVNKKIRIQELEDGTLPSNLELTLSVSDSYADVNYSYNLRFTSMSQASLAAAEQYAVIISQGTAFSFGRGRYGQLAQPGATTHSSHPKPKPITRSALDEVVLKKAIANYGHTFVVSDEGEVYSFGNNSYGQLGHSGTSNQEFPRKLPVSGIRSGSTGQNMSLLLDNSGRVFAFGRNYAGGLGLGDTSDRTTPTPIPQTGHDGLRIEQVVSGSNHSLMLDDKGNVYSFGANRFNGRLGHGDTDLRRSPTLIESLEDNNIVSIAAGSDHSLAVDDQGRVYAFGNNRDGQLGVNSSESQLLEPTQLTFGLEDVFITAAYAGGNSSLLLDDQGQVYVFGSNSYGQLGLGHTNDQRSPVKLEFSEAVVAASKGINMALLLTEKNNIFAMGQGGYGRLGLCDSNNRLRPTQLGVASGCTVEGLSPVYSVTFNADDFGREVLSFSHGQLIETSPSFERKGYEVKDWYKDEALTERWALGLDQVQTNMTLYPEWQLREYKVHLNTSQDDVMETLRAVYQEELTLPATLPERTGHEFVEWNTQLEGGGKAYQPEDTLVIETSDIQLYAIWETASYQVKFLDADGYILEAQTVMHGEPALEPETTPRKRGLTFDGWSTSFNEITADLTLEPVFLEPEYSLNLKLNEFTQQAYWLGRGTNIPGGTISVEEAVFAEAPFDWPEIKQVGGVVYDDQGNLYVSDQVQNKVYRRSTSGNLTTYEGFNQPKGLHFQSGLNSILVADHGSSSIKRIRLDTGAVTEYASLPSAPFDLVSDSNLNIYATADASVLRVNTNLEATIFAGHSSATSSFRFGFNDATGTTARFDQPRGLVIADGYLYVTDRNNNRIRQVELATASVTTLVGANAGGQDGDFDQASFDWPVGLTLDTQSQHLYVADQNNHQIRRIDLIDQRVETLAGSGVQGHWLSSGPLSQFDRPRHIAIHTMSIQPTWMLVDQKNLPVQLVQGGADTPKQPQVADVPEFPTWLKTSASDYQVTTLEIDSQVDNPGGITWDQLGNYYYSDRDQHVIYKRSPAGEESLFAGSPGAAGHSNGDRLEAARFDDPRGLHVDHLNRLLIADSGNDRIRAIDLDTGEVTDIHIFSSGRSPKDLVSDLQGNIYSVVNNYIHRLSSSGDGMVFAGSTSSFTNNTDGIGTSARFDAPFGITFAQGRLYVTDEGNHRIRAIDLATRAVTTLVSSGLEDPRGITADSQGHLYVVDSANHRIIQVSTSDGEVLPFAGQVAGNDDGPTETARFTSPRLIAHDGYGRFMVIQSFLGETRVRLLAANEYKVTGQPPSWQDTSVIQLPVVDPDHNFSDESLALGLGYNAIIVRALSNGQITSLESEASLEGSGADEITLKFESDGLTQLRKAETTCSDGVWESANSYFIPKVTENCVAVFEFD